MGICFTPCLQIVAQYFGAKDAYEPVKPIQWMSADNTPVVNRPLCDFDGNGQVCANAGT